MSEWSAMAVRQAASASHPSGKDVTVELTVDVRETIDDP